MKAEENAETKTFEKVKKKIDSQLEMIAKRLGMDQKTIHYHLGKMATLPNFLNRWEKEMERLR